ncbi:MAG: NAD-dependent deacylase [Bacteroidales bacterium]|nr:NAD-dependent deacylase [Bacteroidales bacterium]
MKKVVVLSGAGISKESGIPTFRDNDGLWKSYRFEEVASPLAWKRNPELVLDFYNFRRRVVVEAEPNEAHILLADLQRYFDMFVITQNVDDLHERAGTKNILHLHGQIRQARSTADENVIVDLPYWELNLGDLCPKGSQLRPNIVWFGESVPNIPKAIEIVKHADIFLVIGTGLQVYPAASLIDYVPSSSENYLIDPSDDLSIRDFYHYKNTAVNGMKKFYDFILKKM